MTLTNPLRAAALAARERGLACIPTNPMTKAALVAWRRFQKEPPTVGQVEGWWARWPGAAPALVTGARYGLVVVDVDDLDHGQALRVFGETCRVAATPRGGAHLYYAHPAQGPIPSRVRVPGVGIPVDLRAEGAYAIIPPTRGYRWLRRGDLGALPAYRAPAEEERRDAVRQLPTRLRSRWAGLLEGAEEGQRNMALARLVGHLVQAGIPGDLHELVALEWARRCRPPLPPAEAVGTVRRVQQTATRRGDTIAPPLFGDES